jgi:hypothetical protein
MTAGRAIVMVSLGDRQWRDLPAETFAHYARKTGADFYLETELPARQEFPFPDMPDRPGRDNKIAYASKAYFVFKYLGMGYERLLIVDDTCLAAPETPDVFDLVPLRQCGFKKTDRKSAEISFASIRKFQSQRGEDPISLSASHYMNSGFLIYDTSMRDAFSPQRIIDAKDLLYCKFPNQSLTYYLLKRAKTELFPLPAGFNMLPARHLPSGSRRAIRDVSPYLGDGYVYHVTSHFAHRRKIIRQIYGCMAEGWGTRRSSAGPFQPEVFPLRSEIRALKAKLAAAKVREQRMQERLIRMEQSLSWRITRPLRGFARALSALSAKPWGQR